MRTLLLSLAVLLGAVPVSAATFTVTKTADTNDGACNADCSLREALAAANADPAFDDIGFDPALAGQTITLALGELTVSSALTITAPVGGLTIDADRRSQVLDVVGGPAELVGLTITGGWEFSDYGGGLYVSSPEVTTLRQCLVTGNEAGPELDGGGIYAASELHVIESTISDNLTYDTRGGGLALSAEATIERSTISGNFASQGGGLSVSRDDVVTITNSTITDNDAWDGVGGIDLAGIGSGRVRIANSVVAGNGSDCDAAAVEGSGGHNVFGTGTGCPANGPGDVTVNPSQVFTLVLDPDLADNGGPTPTHALVWDPANPALDLGGTCGPTDQRGFPAPTDGPDPDATPECDAGSVEQGAPAALVAVTIAPTGPTSVPPGGTFRYGVEVSVAADGPSELDLWVEVTFPNGNTRTVKGPLVVLLTPGSSSSFGFRLRVPSGASAGSYALTASVGTYPDGVVSSDALAFEVTAPSSAVASRGAPARRGSEEGWVLSDESGRELSQGAMIDLRTPEVSASEGAATAAVAEGVPEAVVLRGARPNPFAERTTLGYDLPEASHARLVVYDVLGREVAVLVDREAEAGRHAAVFDGSGLPAGTYVVRLVAGGAVQTTRLTLVR